MHIDKQSKLRIVIKISLLIFLISCSKRSVTKRYFNSNINNTKSSNLHLDDFESYGDLMDSIEKIASLVAI